MNEQDPEGWDGEDRRDATMELVNVAALTAAQVIAQINRRRIVVWTFIVALVTSAAIGLTVTLVVNGQRAKDAAANSRYNCGLLTEVGDVLHDFIASDAKLRRDQQTLGNRVEIKSGLSKLFGSKVLRDLTAQSKALDRDAQAYWRKNLLPRIAKPAAVNCAAVITTGGPQDGATGSTGSTVP